MMITSRSHLSLKGLDSGRVELSVLVM